MKDVIPAMTSVRTDVFLSFNLENVYSTIFVPYKTAINIIRKLKKV
jgi:hypothetical protein